MATISNITNTINTRIALKYDTLTNWMNSDLVLKKGEVAVVEIPNQHTILNVPDNKPENTPPTIAMKIGDGAKIFSALPWVQAVAGDVYNWAKQPNKPTYEADDIAGLTEFIQTTVGNISEVQDTDTTYKLVPTSGKYKVTFEAYKKSGERDQSKDLVLDWSDINEALDNAQDVLNKVDNEVTESNLIVTQTGLTNHLQEVFNGHNSVVSGSGNYISDVTQSKGIVTVTKTNLTHDLVTDWDTELAKKQDVLPFNTNPSKENWVATRDDIASLQGAMHFHGMVATDPTSWPNPADNPNTTTTNEGYVSGDVVILQGTAKEFVFNGTTWLELGDETIYAVKEVVNEQFAEVNETIAELSTSVAGKQDKLQHIDNGPIAADNPLLTKNSLEAFDDSLHKIAKTGNVEDLVQDTGDVIFFQCGTSTSVI